LVAVVFSNTQNCTRYSWEAAELIDKLDVCSISMFMVDYNPVFDSCKKTKLWNTL